MYASNAISIHTIGLYCTFWPQTLILIVDITELETMTANKPSISSVDLKHFNGFAFMMNK